MNLGKLFRNEWERVAAGVCVVAGLIALYLGWRGVSDHTLATEQLPYIASGALLGLFLLGVGSTLWISADLRDTWKFLRDVYEMSVSEDTDGELASVTGDEDLGDTATGELGAVAPEERFAMSANGARRRAVRASRR